MTDWLAPIQNASTTSGSGTSNALSFTLPVTSGNGIAGVFVLENAANSNIPAMVSAVTDDKGNLYDVTMTGYDGGGGAFGLSIGSFMSQHLITNGAKTVTLHTNVSCNIFFQGQVELQPPTGTTDWSLSGQQYMCTGTGPTLPGFPILDNDCFVLCGMVSSGACSHDGGNGFTGIFGDTTQFCLEYKLSNQTSNFSASFASLSGTPQAVALAIAPVAQKRWKPVLRAIEKSVSSASTASLSFAAPVPFGAFVTIFIQTGDLTQITSFTDDKGNNYVPVPGTSANARQIFVSNGLICNFPQTITVNFSGTQGLIHLSINAFMPPPGTGSVAIDGTPVNIFESNVETITTSPTITMSYAGDLVYSFSDIGGSGVIPNNGFTSCNGQSITSWDGYQNASAGSLFQQCTHGSTVAGGNNISLVAFQAIPASGGASSPIIRVKRPGFRWT